MSIGRYLFAVVSLGVVGIALTAAAHRMRTRWTELSTAEGLVADAVLAFGMLFVICQVLGTVGAFAPVPLLIATLATAIAITVTVRGPVRPTRSPEHGTDRRSIALAASCAALTFATWMVATAARGISGGIRESDSIQYHLTRAAFFMQEQRLTGVHYAAAEFPDAYHPSNSETLHALGMMFFRSDVLSPILNIGWLGLLLLAGWAVGTRWRQRPITLAAVAFALAIPGLAWGQGGTATNDAAALFFLLASVTLLASTPRSRVTVAIAAAAAGLAMGTKLTTAAPVAALTVVALILRPTDRWWSWLWTWVLPLSATGSFWYARNLFHTGSPVPAMRLEFLGIPYGGFGFVDRLGRTFASYVFDADAWTDFFLPALREYIGPLWWLTLGVSIAGAIAVAVRGRSVTSRLLAAVAVAALVAYAFTPTTAFGPDGTPFLFIGNLVYAVPGLLLALVVTGTIDVPLRWWAATIAGVLALQLVALIGEGSPWRLADPREVLAGVFATAIVAMVVAAVAVPSLRRWSVPVVLAVAIVGSYPVASGYLDRRYGDDALSRFAEAHAGRSIAWAGLRGPYRLHDAALTTSLRMVGTPGPHGAIHPARSCTGWREALRDGRFDLIVLRPGTYGRVRPSMDAIEAEIGVSSIGEHQLVWTRTDPAASHERELGRLVVFDFDPDVADPGCDG